jgi:hypothetical protein
MSETERHWSWWAGYDEERYTVGPCTTREEAIAEAISSCIFSEIEPKNPGDPWTIRFYVIEATQWQISDIKIDANTVLENLSEHVYEEMLDPEGDGNLFDLSPEDTKNLSLFLTKAFHEWAVDKKLKNWAFKDSRNGEWIELPHPGVPAP